MWDLWTGKKTRGKFSCMKKKKKSSISKHNLNISNYYTVTVFLLAIFALPIEEEGEGNEWNRNLSQATDLQQHFQHLNIIALFVWYYG